MSEYKILTAESVTEGHPDKLCDIIADSVLDACLETDPASRVACEVLATAGKVIVAGEITTEEMPDIPYIVSRTIKHIGYDDLEYEIECLIHDQSGDIAQAVERLNDGIYLDKTTGQLVDESCSLGAGDQGIMYGYATTETREMLPMPVVLAHRMTRLLTAARRLNTIRTHAGRQGPGVRRVCGCRSQAGNIHRGIHTAHRGCGHGRPPHRNYGSGHFTIPWQVSLR